MNWSNAFISTKLTSLRKMMGWGWVFCRKSASKYGLQADSMIWCALNVWPEQARVTSVRASLCRRLLRTSARFVGWLFHRRQNCWSRSSPILCRSFSYRRSTTKIHALLALTNQKQAHYLISPFNFYYLMTLEDDHKLELIFAARVYVFLRLFLKVFHK